MSSCQPQRYELLPNCNVWIAILIYGGGTKEPLALLGRDRTRGAGYILYKVQEDLYSIQILIQYEDVGQKRSHLAIIEPIPHRF